MADRREETNTFTIEVEEKIEQPQFYIQLFADWKSDERPYERMIKEILLDHFLPDEID